MKAHRNMSGTHDMKEDSRGKKIATLVFLFFGDMLHLYHGFLLVGLRVRTL
jgi:hypothetical protein